MALLAPTLAAAEGEISVEKPDVKAPIMSWTAVQQWMPWRGDSSPHYDYGYGTLAGALLITDELGDKLSELGRATFVDRCFRQNNYGANAGSTLVWTLCGPDAKALDLKKLESELTANSVKPDEKAGAMTVAKEIKDKAMKVGAFMEAAAKDDPGLQQLFKITDQAKAEWTAYVSKNKADFERYLALKDAVRSGKTNNPAFKGCYEATKPAFEKLVKAAAPKIPWDVGNDYLPGYVWYLRQTPEGYITTVAWAACAWSIHEAGEAPYVAAANSDFGGNFRAGWRTIALGKVLDEKLKPKFADRSLNMGDWTFQWKYGAKMTGVNDIAAIMTRSEGVVGTLKTEGDVTKVAFKGNKVEACLQWKETNKPTGVAAGGQVTYEKVCKKRGMVDNQTTAEEVPAKYMSGVKVGDTFASVKSFPVVAWKGKKLTMLLGVPLK
ncbi:MAG: hypothetical protein M4D80_35875 [Myxococcota bacterium]|nr:hypothetical protein [Myxococcota bacterium]